MAASAASCTASAGSPSTTTTPTTDTHTLRLPPQAMGITPGKSCGNERAFKNRMFKGALCTRGFSSRKTPQAGSTKGRPGSSSASAASSDHQSSGPATGAPPPGPGSPPGRSKRPRPPPSRGHNLSPCSIVKGPAACGPNKYSTTASASSPAKCGLELRNAVDKLCGFSHVAPFTPWSTGHMRAGTSTTLLLAPASCNFCKAALKEGLRNRYSSPVHSMAAFGAEN
mmetsp:Transcript_51141/g.165562  ORF Transcript_51141/g.165562 Transcript_51141/m.165562 type:complete len:226 (+) Transcript_51141:3169-3846(+)